MNASPSKLSHPKYRADIDGLRAIAVISVLVFHAFPTILQSGFIGVDVFFVVSGFLISTIIFDSLDKHRFSFTEFYSRRIRRIFPALIVVLFASYGLGWISLFSEEFKQLAKHITAGAGFVSNFVLWGESNYFDTAAETKPLLHLWSLGIEEQFYLLWPLLVWFAWRIKFRLLLLIVLVGSASFVLNLQGIGENSVATFYSPQTRFWELLVGSLLAWFTLYGKSFEKFFPDNPSDSHTLSNIISGLGCLILAYGFWQIDKTTQFPGLWAALPVMGTALVILAGPHAHINRVFLSNKVLVWFGLISFPLYLWHWPLLSFARIIESEVPELQVRLILLSVSVLLAWATYKWVEQPIRSGGYRSVKVAVLCALMVVLAGIGLYTIQQDGIESRAVIHTNASINSGYDGGDQGQMAPGCGIADNFVRKLFRFCAQDKRGNIRFALIGDSKADALYAGLVRTSSSGGRWLFIAGGGWTPKPLLVAEDKADANQVMTNHAVAAIAGNMDIQYVVIASAIRTLFTLSDGVKGGNQATYDYKYLKSLSASNRYAKTFEELDEFAKYLASRGKKLVLVVDNPALPNPQDCIQRHTSSDLLNSVLGGFNRDCVVALPDFNTDIQLYRMLLGQLKSANPDTVFIFDPTHIYCSPDTQRCEATRNGRLLYSYTDHISDYSAGLVGTELNQFLLASP